MDIALLTLLAGLSVFVGILVGGVGIGGVLLVPILTYILAIDIHIAIAAAMFSYMFSGIVGAVIYARQGSIQWSMSFWLLVSAAPAAFLAAFASSVIPPKGLEFFIAVLIVFAGINALRPQGNRQLRESPLSRGALVATGTVTGVGSALSGTGGPLVLVPILVWLRFPARVAIGLSQAIQIPIAIMATAGNYIYGTVDFVLGSVIAIGLVAGVTGGAYLAHVISQAALQRLVAWVLVAVGFFIIGRISLSLIAG